MVELVRVYAGVTQTLPTQTIPAPHGVHAAVQCMLSVSEAQVLALAPLVQRWNVGLQVGTHLRPTQSTLSAWAGTAQGVQDEPQLAALVLERQVGAAAVPHRWNPGVLHSTPQASGFPSQVAMPLAGGAGQGVQDVPQVLTDSTDEQEPAAVFGQR